MGDHARPVPSIVVHGSSDRTVVPINADHALEQSMTANRFAAPERDDLDISRPTTAWRGQVDYTDPRGPDATGAIWRFFAQVAGDTPQG